MTPESLQALHFLRPEWLLALLPLLLLLVIVLRRQRTSAGWRSVCDESLLPHVLTTPQGARSTLPAWLAAIAAALAIIAAAGPAWEKLPQPVFRDDSAVVIALDLSQSMDATDIKPTRLSRARLKVLDILDQRSSGQTALLVYAADAFVVAPLTDDTDTIVNLVPTLETAIMPAQGSDTSAAISKAHELLQQAGIHDGHIILLTDGIGDRHLQRLDSLMTAEHRLSIIGIGSDEGSPIPMAGGFLTDRDGSIVIPVLERDALRQAAAAGGGLYRDMSNDDSDVTAVLALGSSNVNFDTGEQDVTAESWREEGPWLLLLVLPLAALLARRGWLGVLVICMLPLGEDAHAFELQDLWSTPDQRGMRAYEQGAHEDAARAFEDPRWRSSAWYRAGEFYKALDHAGEPETSDDYYNRGNALAQLGELDAARDHYDKALELDPDNEDAAWNRDLVEQEIERRQQQQQQEQRQQDQQQQNRQGDQDSQQQSDTQNDEAESQPSSQDQQQGNSGQQQDSDEQGEPQQGAQQEQGEMEDQQQQAETNEQQQSGEQAPNELEQQGQSEMEQAARAREQEQADRQASNIEDIRQGEFDEQARATEQWLQRIPDDPGGLLRRKFHYQYKQRGGNRQEQQPW